MGAFEEHDRVHVRLGKDLALLLSTIMAEVDLDRGEIRLKCPKKHCTVLSRVKEIQSFEYREVRDSNTEGRMGGQQSFDIPYLEGSEIGGRHMCEELKETLKDASNVFCWTIEFEIEFSEKFETARAFAWVATGLQEPYERHEPLFASKTDFVLDRE